MTLTKDYIRELKHSTNGEISLLIKNYKDSASLVFIMENLGQLPNNFDGSFLLQLLEHNNASVRLWAVKTIGKLSDNTYLDTLQHIALFDEDTNVRREAVSSIGRYRNNQGKNILFDFLNEKDPKILNQAIRGLLIFKGDKKVDEQLIPLINHPNEMVRTVIYKEYFPSKTGNSKQSHTESYDYLKNIIVNADNIEAMKLIKDESIHLTFTSPPYYNARDYSIYPSYKDYLIFLDSVFKEVHRITKEGRFLIINTSPIIIPRISRQHSSKRYPIPFDIHPYLVKMGWEFIDDIIWLKPEASVKNRIGGFQQHRKPLAYKPNTVTEYLMVYRKSTDKLLDWNIRQYEKNTVENSLVPEPYETTNVWKIDPCFDKVHSAVFPEELCNRVIKFYSYKGDLVLDPFAGSGTVGRASRNLGRFSLLLEKDKSYFDYMKTKFTKQMFDKFDTKFLSLEEFNKAIK